MTILHPGLIINTKYLQRLGQKIEDVYLDFCSIATPLKIEIKKALAVDVTSSDIVQTERK